MKNRLWSKTASEKFLGYEQDFEIEVLAVLGGAWGVVAAGLVWWTTSCN